MLRTQPRLDGSALTVWRLVPATLLLLPLSAALSAQVQPQDKMPVTPVHYELEVDIDYEGEQIHGAARITVRNRTAAPVTEFSLLLYRLMGVSSVTDTLGAALSFDQAIVSYEDYGKLQVNRVRVALRQPLPPSSDFTIEVTYGGYLLGYTETGMRYVRDRVSPEFTLIRPDAHAYPEPGYPSWEARAGAPLPSFDYVARISVPDTLIVANGGRLVEVRRERGRATYVYESLRPSWRMDFAVAPFGRMEEGPVRVFYLPGDSTGASGVLRAASQAMDRYTSWFGALRGRPGLTFIELPDGWGSQADVTAILQTAAAFRDTTRHPEVYHEICHLWDVRQRDLPSPRWEEGLASFLQYRVQEEVTGREAMTPGANNRITWLKANAPSRPAWADTPLVDYGAAQLTDLSYRVGALFFDLLFRLAGPDEFDRIYREYYRTYAETGARTEDFVRIANEIATPDLTRLFSDWFTTTAWIERITEAETVDELVGFYR